MRYSEFAITLLTVTAGVARAAPTQRLQARAGGLGGALQIGEEFLESQDARLARLAAEAGEAGERTVAEAEQSPLIKQVVDGSAPAGEDFLSGASDSKSSLDRLLEHDAPIANSNIPPATELKAQAEAMVDSLNPSEREALAREVGADIAQISPEGQAMLQAGVENPVAFAEHYEHLPLQDQIVFESIQQKVVTVAKSPALQRTSHQKGILASIAVVFLAGIGVSLYVHYMPSSHNSTSTSSSAAPKATVPSQSPKYYVP